MVIEIQLRKLRIGDRDLSKKKIWREWVVRFRGYAHLRWEIWIHQSNSRAGRNLICLNLARRGSPNRQELQLKRANKRRINRMHHLQMTQYPLTNREILNLEEHHTNLIHLYLKKLIIFKGKTPPTNSTTLMPKP